MLSWTSCTKGLEPVSTFRSKLTDGNQSKRKCGGRLHRDNKNVRSMETRATDNNVAVDEEPTPEWGTSDAFAIGAPLLEPTRDLEPAGSLWLANFIYLNALALLNTMAVRAIEVAESSAGELDANAIKALMQAIKKFMASLQQSSQHQPATASSKTTQDEIKYKIFIGQVQMLADVITMVTGAPETHPFPSPPDWPAEVDDYKELFQCIEVPEIADTFDTDEWFAKMRIAGANPMILTGITSAELHDLTGNRITDTQYNAVMNTNDDTLEKAGDEGRLCVVNYKALSTLGPYTEGDKRIVTTPIAVFAEPLSNDKNAAIKPVAIQLGQRPEDSQLVMANTDDTYRWKIAKALVQIADLTYHEMVEHLASAHLVSEAFSVATQMNFDEDHPLRRLLGPHYEGTNNINRLGTKTLMNDGGPVHRALAAMQDDRLTALRSLTVGPRIVFDFSSRMPDVQLGSRNIDKLKVYPYRDDALLIWNAILEWAKDYVNLYYADDNAVENDIQLAAWAKDVEKNALLMNFYPPKKKDELVRTLAMLMFTASAQHAALNYPQGKYMIYPPAYPALAWDVLPPEGAKATKQQYLNMLPPKQVALDQVNFLYVLGTFRYRLLGEYKSTGRIPLTTIEPKAQSALKKFNDELKKIEDKITAANKERDVYEYPFLLPSNIPASTNI